MPEESSHERRTEDAVRSTDEYEGMIAETITLPGHGGDHINAYYARPLGAGPYPAVVLFHHRPGWDEWYREATRRFAHHGYLALCPDLYSRFPPGPPDEVAARARAEGDVSDEQVVADGLAGVSFVRAQLVSSGKVALMGTCSGGRHAYLARPVHRPGADRDAPAWRGRGWRRERRLRRGLVPARSR